MNGLGTELNYEFGDYRLQTEDATLWRGTERLAVTQKAVEFLTLLVENAGRVVPRDQIIESLWPNTYVDENNLSVTASMLRKALGEAGAGLIETIPRKGYRFAGEVSTHLPPITTREFTRTVIERTEIEDSQSAAVAALAQNSNRQNALIAVFGLLIVCVFSIFVWASYFKGDAKPTVRAASFQPFYGNPAPSVLKTVLVMPFKQVNSNALGFDTQLAGNLIARLGSLNKFNVRPLDSLMSEETRIAFGETGFREKADFVLNGTVETTDGRFRIMADLLEVRSSRQLWQRDISDADMTRLQEQLTDLVASSITATLSPSEADIVARRKPTSIAAYAEYLRGYSMFRGRKDPKPHLIEAIKLDPQFAQAYALLAASRSFDGWKGSPQALEARNYLEKSFALDNQLADAYAVQGFIQAMHENDWPGARRSLQQALELDPNCINAHQWLAALHAIHRQLDDARAELGRALELDPTSPALLADMGELNFFAGDKDQAREYARRAIIIEPESYFAKGMLAKLDFPKELSIDALLKEAEYRKANNSFGIAYMNVDPKYDPIRNDPGFRKIIAELRIAEQLNTTQINY